MHGAIDRRGPRAGQRVDPGERCHATAGGTVELRPVARGPEGEDIDAVVQGRWNVLAQFAAVFHVMAGRVAVDEDVRNLAGAVGEGEEFEVVVHAVGLPEVEGGGMMAFGPIAVNGCT